MTFEQSLRVTAIRSQNPRGFGGCIFSAKPIDSMGRVEDAGSYFVVKANRIALGGARVEPGQWWTVAGEPSIRILDVNGYRVVETQIEATRAILLRPSGEHIVSFLADNPAFEGIGYVKARKLWETFGEQIYDHLDKGTGGAGVGKTTVLKALYEVYDRAGLSVTQLALAGRAAKRMQEATGRPASTIANFLRSQKQGELDDHSVVIVDEASMVDIITMSRLCELIGHIPRLVLVGDPAQLMPVGPGLVLQALAKVPAVPLAQLTVVKRYGGAIALAAAAIRQGVWPELPSDPDAAIAFIRCVCRASSENEAAIPETVLRLYRQDPTNTQILCARRNGPDGANGLNSLCQSALTAEAKPVQVWDERHGAYARVGLHLGDPVLCTRNLWDRGLQNGSLGVVVQVDDGLRMCTDDGVDESGQALAWVDWDDGIRRPIVEEMLDDLELGYAITVHKAQGSQWPRVIVPLTGHRLLDRTLVYTAVTRAQRHVLLVGDEAAAKKAVEGLPRPHARQVSLDLIVSQLLRGE